MHVLKYQRLLLSRPNNDFPLINAVMKRTGKSKIDSIPLAILTSMFVSEIGRQFFRILFSVYFSGPWRVPGEVGQNRLQTSQVSVGGSEISKSAKLFNVCSNIRATFRMGRLLWYSYKDLFCSIPDRKPLFLSL